MFVQESSDEEKGLTFAEVLPKEIEVLRKARRKREVPERPILESFKLWRARTC